MTDSSSQETIWLLRGAIQLYGSGIRRALLEAGHRNIPPRGMWAIEALHRGGGSCPPRVLVEELRVTKQAVSQLVELLEGLGYVRRDEDPNDGRRKVIALTDRGRNAASVMQDARTVIDSQMERRLGPELNGLKRLLHEMVRESNEFRAR